MAGFKNTILGGAETLIRSAIKSFNYVVGVSGWRIAKDGSAELNDATIRGQLLAGGGNVRVNSNGIHVQGATKQWDINGSAGFLARESPDDGSFAQLDVSNNGSINGGVVFLRPATPSPHGNNIDSADLFANYQTIGATEVPYLLVSSAVVTGKADASFLMKGQDSVSLTDNSTIEIDASQINFNGNATCHDDFVTNRPRWIANWGNPSIATNVGNVTGNLTPSVVNVNTGGMGVGGTVTIPTLDVWNMGMVLKWATNGTGFRMARIYLNGADYASFPIPTVAGFNTSVQIQITALLQAGDVLTFGGWQNSGGNLALTGGGNVAWVIKELA
jgi:hypothetical protein